MLNLILFGPPGSGKGTQAALLAKSFQLEHISTGDLLRSEKAAGTELGLKAKAFMDQGALVPDEVVIGMIANKLDEKANEVEGFIFDGFPRTVAQAEALDVLLMEKSLRIDRVLSLTVSEEELVKRILNRGLTSGRVDDQDEATIQKRVGEYNTKTAPVAGFYREQGKLVEVAGEGSIDEITKSLCHEIDALAGS